MQTIRRFVKLGHRNPNLTIALRSLWTSSSDYTRRKSSTSSLLDSLSPSLKEDLDPFSLVADELSILANRLRAMVVAEVPKLASAAEYFFKMGVEGKRFRPTLLRNECHDFPWVRTLEPHMFCHPAIITNDRADSRAGLVPTAGGVEVGVVVTVASSTSSEK
ncbi:hypothetical protein GIB67_031144 [Kingdonia uniflora]|uniref:Uncharacterized protein n=1 Tax=Kingdonia uniflora TaxID=39325 RepID=A0A7J7LCU1_9MAGN|nr:hypothetical protein GIB67_031144 [Kingdonia uniflora]